MFENEFETVDEWIIPPPPPEEEEPRWTWRRVILLIIALIVILAFLGTSYLPGIFVWMERRNQPPEPTRTPLPQAYEHKQKIEVVSNPDSTYILIF